MREVLEAHAAGAAAPLEGAEELHVDGVRIWFEEAKREPIRNNAAALRQFSKLLISGDFGRAAGFDDGRFARDIARRECVAPVADADGGRYARLLEQVMAKLQVGPEAFPFLAAPQPEIALGHAEGEDMHSEARLAVFERSRDHAPNLIDRGIGHGIAADRTAAAMHHEE